MRPMAMLLLALTLVGCATSPRTAPGSGEPATLAILNARVWGSQTAAFHAPFTDAPEDKGLPVNTPEDLYRWVSGADKAGLHVMVHAIGDRAIGLQLDTFATSRRRT